MSKNLILKNLRKQYGSLVAVNDVNLEIEQGEFLCFLGPSGCGKTTILRMITGFEEITSGSIIFDGKVINDVIPQKRDFGIVFQTYALFPNMTVTQNIAFGLKMRKMPQKLIDERGRAIAIKPNVLLLDEPLSALDAKIRLRLRTVIKRLQEDLGITLIYVTHDQEEALALADRVVIMRDGEFRQIDSPWKIYKEPKTSFIAEFVGTSNFITGKRENGKVRFGAQSFAVSDLNNVSGETVYLAIRPEHIELVEADNPPENITSANIIEAAVEVVNFLGAVVRIAFMLEGEEMFVDIPEKEFEKITLKRKDIMKLYFPPEAFHSYSELFRKLI